MHRGGHLRTVRLLDVPAAPFVRLQLHIDDLLREVLIAALGHDTGTALVAPELRAIKGELLDGHSDTRWQAWQQAEAAERAGRARADIEVAVPVDAAESFARLGDALEQADRLASSGVLLTVPMADELVRLRGWMIAEIGRQLRDGAEPTPYTG